MTERQPEVSVILPVYNRVDFVELAVQSIREQTFEDFEFIIIDDGSTDGSGAVLQEFARQDSRIRLIHQENSGLIVSLNRGLNLAEGHYIARMDSDDISHPERFERQVRFLEANSSVGVLGTTVDFIDTDGSVIGTWPVPQCSDVIAWQLLFNNCVCHPSVMLRRSVMDSLGGYAPWATFAEDYELWTRAIQITQISNLPDSLLQFRRHDDSVTVHRRMEQIQTCCQIAANLHGSLLGKRRNEHLSAFLVLMETSSIDEATQETGIRDVAAVHKYLRSLYDAYVNVLLQGTWNTGVRRRALSRLNSLEEEIVQQDGWLSGLVNKLRARLMPPRREITTWGMQLIRRRLG